MRRMFIFLFLVFLVLVFGGGWFYLNTKPVSLGEDYQDFLVTKGSGAGQVAFDLQKKGLIRSALAFKLYVRLTGKAQKIQAGEYRFSPHYSLFRIVATFLKGPTEIWVTIPEGLRREEIAERYALALGKDAAFKTEFLSLTENLEGQLFPDTYLFSKEISAAQIIEKMTNTFEKKVNVPVARETLILASLIERETKTSAERPVVSGILSNRLRIKMPLQVDATLQYLKGRSGSWWGTVLSEDRKIISPFNTYLNRGLPPAPICNPGLSSIMAALYPEKTEYLYYLHGADGLIHYAVTLEDHNANIARYLKP